MEKDTNKQVYIIEDILGVRHYPQVSRKVTVDATKSQKTSEGRYLIPSTIGFVVLALQGVKYPSFPERVTYRDDPHSYEIKWLEYPKDTRVILTTAEFSLWALVYTEGRFELRGYSDVEVHLRFVEPQPKQLPIMRTHVLGKDGGNRVIADYVTAIDPESRLGRGQKESVFILEEYQDKFGYYARAEVADVPRVPLIDKTKRMVLQQYGDLLPSN